MNVQRLGGGRSFAENALKKARFYSKYFGKIKPFSDDSGLNVDILKGLPGIYSCRYAGERATNQENNQKHSFGDGGGPFQKGERDLNVRLLLYLRMEGKLL